MNLPRLVSTLAVVPLLALAVGAHAQSKADAAADAKKPAAAATTAPAAKKAGTAAQPAAGSTGKAVDGKAVAPASLRSKPAGADAYPSDCQHAGKDSDA